VADREALDPGCGGVVLEGDAEFTSATRDEMVDRTRSGNCEPVNSSDSTTDPSSTLTDPSSGSSTSEGGASEFNIDVWAITSRFLVALIRLISANVHPFPGLGVPFCLSCPLGRGFGEKGIR
jgi:hypothetical protein